MPKKFEIIRKMEILKDFPEKNPRYAKGEIHYASKQIAEKLKKAGVAKVSEYDRKGAIEREKKEIADLKKKQKEILQETV